MFSALDALDIIPVQMVAQTIQLPPHQDELPSIEAGQARPPLRELW